jgi:hypothetical protein
VGTAVQINRFGKVKRSFSRALLDGFFHFENEVGYAGLLVPSKLKALKTRGISTLSVDSPNPNLDTSGLKAKKGHISIFDNCASILVTARRNCASV